MPGSPSHLVRRFFEVLTANPLDEAEKRQVDDWLDPRFADLFFAQSTADQRHGFHAATVVGASPLADTDIIHAAALHDVGKRHAHLGILGRSVASMLILLGLPLSKRMQIYRDHGHLAADELESLDAPPLVSTFAAHHHGRRPASIPSDVWNLLQTADQPQRHG